MFWEPAPCSLIHHYSFFKVQNMAEAPIIPIKGGQDLHQKLISATQMIKS
jgi:hypothetical protein